MSEARRAKPLNASERRRLEAILAQRRIDGLPCEQVERALRVLAWVDARQGGKA